MNYCINAAWHGVDQSVALLRCYESPGCSDSGLQLFCIVGSGVSHLPLDNTPYILYGVQVICIVGSGVSRLDSLWASGQASLLANQAQ